MGRVKDLYWDEICSQRPDPNDNWGGPPDGYEEWASMQEPQSDTDYELMMSEMYSNYRPTSEDLRLKDANGY